MSPLQIHPVSEFGGQKRTEKIEQISREASGKVALFKRVFCGKASPRQAIKAMCLECCSLDEAMIRECPSTACPLWGFRPYQRKGKKS